jgi:hypothetical protein
MLVRSGGAHVDAVGLSRMYDNPVSRKYPLTYPAVSHLPSRKSPKEADTKTWFDKTFGYAPLRKRFKNVIGHGVSTIAIGTFIRFSGPSEIPIKSVGLLICVLWLTTDIGVWLSETMPTRWKLASPAVFSLSFCVVSLVSMNLMRSFLRAALQNQRQDVSYHLTASHSIPPGYEDDPVHTMFTITNNGRYEISRKHEITCYTIFALANHSIVRDTESAVRNGGLVFGDLRENHALASSTIKPGGDAQTDSCLNWFHFHEPTDCVDVEIIFWYALETQPDYEEEKTFRFFAYKGPNNKFDWYPEPIDHPGNYCEQFVK